MKETVLPPRRLPTRYGGRVSDEQAWRERFGLDFPLVDRLLVVFCEAFLFDPAYRFKLRPEDSVSEIYASLYPKPQRWWQLEKPDALEMNFLIDGLKEEFGITFDDTGARLERIETFTQIAGEIKDAQPGVPAYRR